jgi:signal transduction histidine kinase
MSAVQPSLSPATKWPRALLAFELLVILPTVTGVSILFVHSVENTSIAQMLVLTGLLAFVEALPVPALRGVHLSLGFPLLMTYGILMNPPAAALVAFVGSLDPRELHHEVTFLRAVFNRCQVALSVLAASAVFHRIATIGPPASSVWLCIAGAMLAALADYVVNSSLVTIFTSLRVGVSPLIVIRELRIGRLSEFLISYLGLGLLGLVGAVLATQTSYWTIPFFLAPLLFARQMFFRSKQLEEAHGELIEREQVLKTLSNAMAEERADERLQIAGYLHDDLAQVLFRLSIQVDVARKLMDKEDYPQVTEQLEKIRESKQETSDRIRALIRDLHRSPLGAKGLAEALESFTDEVGRDSGVMYHRDVEDIPLPAPIALLVYHIAREGVMNSLKHAHASDMWISVRQDGESIELELRDNGLGFDTTAPGPEGHFGMAMMRERASVGGGSFEVQSAPGAGTTITVRFPIALLQQEGTDGTPPRAPGSGDGASGTGASPGTPASNESASGDSRQTVRA